MKNKPAVAIGIMFLIAHLILLPRTASAQSPNPPDAAPDPDALAAKSAALSLEDCLEIALSLNPDIKIERIAYVRSQLDITVEDSEFDPGFSAAFSYSDSHGPTSSLTSGSHRKTAEMSLGYGARLRNGDSYDLSLSKVITDTDSSQAALDPSFALDWTLIYNRPLAKGRGREITLYPVRISRLNNSISALEFKDEITNVLFRVESAYWRLLYARQNLLVREESLQLARKTLARARGLVQAGALAKSQILLVETELASREENVISAWGELQKAVLDLKLVMSVDTDSTLWEAMILPDDSMIAAPQFDPLPFSDAMKTARANRPDYLNALTELEIAEIKTASARDGTRPSVNLRTSVGLGGLHGEYFKALQDITAFQYPSWQVGVWLDLPVKNRQAEAVLDQRLGDANISRLQIEKAGRTMAVEVAEAEVALKTADKKMEAARVTREYSEKKLAEEEDKYTLGAATTHDVLEFQEDLALARLNEVKTIIDYNTTVIDYYLVLGILIEKKGIHLSDDIAEESRVQGGAK